MFQRSNDSELTRHLLGLVGNSDYQGSGRVIVGDIEGDGEVTIKELLSGEQYERSAKEMRESGLFVIVPSWYGQIFSY